MTTPRLIGVHYLLVRRTWWHAIAVLAATVLSGCIVFEPGAVVLDIGNSRIPLAIQGVWAEEGKAGDEQMVIESTDGRVGHIYQMVGTGDKRKIKSHLIFLMTPVEKGLYLFRSIDDLDSDRNDAGQALHLVRLGNGLLARISRLNSEDGIDDLDLLRKTTNRYGLAVSASDPWLLSSEVSLTSLRKRVAADVAVQPYKSEEMYRRQEKSAIKGLNPWTTDETRSLRRFHDIASADLRGQVQRLLATPLSDSNATQQLEKIVNRIPGFLFGSNQSDGSKLLLAIPEGSLQWAAAKRRIAPDMTKEASEKLELKARASAAAFGHVESQVWMGKYDEQRPGNKQSALTSAMRWYQLAANEGSQEGAAGVKRLLANPLLRYQPQ